MIPDDDVVVVVPETGAKEFREISASQVCPSSLVIPSYNQSTGR